MAGLNHEMARELLWRGYPTDQRGTVFRRFWDRAGAVPPPRVRRVPKTSTPCTRGPRRRRSASTERIPPTGH